MKPLEGIRVLDLTRVLSGPYCTMILADFGAEVWKVEAPKGGDDSRAFGPFQEGHSAYFMSINRNKKSLAIDTRTKEGVALVKELIPHVDVVVENFKPGTMEKIGLGEEVLKELNPRLVYTAISGYGHTGPWSSRPAYDAIVQAAGGLMSITGHGPGDFVRVGASIGDITAGLFGAIGTLLALFGREKTGKGDTVDVSMLDSQVAILENAIARYFVKGEVPTPKGNRHSSITPFEDFLCADDTKVMIAIGNNGLWKKFLTVAERMDLYDDPRFATNDARTEHYEELKPIMDAIMKSRPASQWVEDLVAANVPVTLVNNVKSLVENEQVKAREMIVTVDKEGVGPFSMADTPIKLTEGKGGTRTPAPFLGEDTEKILRSVLGKTDEDLDALRRSGALGEVEA